MRHCAVVLIRRRRHALASCILLSISAALVFAAASPPSSSAEPTQTVPGRWKDRTLIVAVPNTPNTLNGDFMSDPVDFTVHWNLYDQLVGWKLRGTNPRIADLSRIVPRIASSWKVSKGGRVYDLTLRRVRNSAGRVLTARDVRSQWEAAWHRAGVGKLLFTVSNIKGPQSIKVLSNQRVRFTLSAPSAIFLRGLTLHTAGVQDTSVVNKNKTNKDPWAAEWLKSHAAGFGPYYVSKFEPGNQVVFRANQNYWGPKPYFQTVIYKAVPSSANRVALLRTGQVDIAEGLSPREYNDLRRAQNVQVVSTQGIRGTSLRMNLNIKPFDDIRVRQAIAYAAPYAETIQQVYFRQARGMQSVFPDKLPGYRAEWKIRRNVERAKQLLAAAGHGNGLDIEFRYSSAVPEMANIAVLLKQSLAEAGIRVTLRATPPQAFSDGLFNHRFGFFIDKDMPLVPDEGYTLFLWFGSSPINYTAYKNATVSRLIDRAFKMGPSRARERVTARAMRTVLNQVPWVPLAFINEQVAMAKGLTGYVWYPLSVVRWSDLRPRSA